MPNRLFAIGDIHGCSVALKALIEAIDPRADDMIVVLGDVIDDGPDTKGVIQQLLALSDRCKLILIAGNHEEMLFKALLSRDDRRYWESCGGTTTRRSYPDRDDRELIDPDHLRFLRENCRDDLETDEFIFVHANYFPDQPMPEQTTYTLRWEAVRPERMPPHFSGKVVLAGHTPQTGGKVLDLGFLTVLDTDASRGGWLTALEVRSGGLIRANQGGEVRTDRPVAGANTPRRRNAE